MKTEIKIIKLFIEEKKSMTIREISKKINSDYRITHTAAQRLIDKSILNVAAVGKSSLCSLNQTSFGTELFTAENQRKLSLLENRNINQLYKEIMKKINSSLFIFLIFGSYAKKTQTKNSDIDMMFVSNDKSFEKNIQNITSILPLKTHAFVFTETEFIRMNNSKKPNVVKEAIINNIILYGVELFYRLKNA